jgi:hypothetical protein
VAWATVAEVGDTTGVTVDSSDLAHAQAVIEVYANRTTDADDGLTTRDLGWLKRAVCWQAAWQSSQYGYAARQTAASVSQDGASVTRRSQSDQDLAPLAARALRNLSWKGSRTQRVRPLGVPRGGGLVETDAQFMRDAFDEDDGWQAM